LRSRATHPPNSPRTPQSLCSQSVAVLRSRTIVRKWVVYGEVDAPVALPVGVRQVVARNAAPQAHVIKLRWHGMQTGLDIAKTFPIRQLGKGHHAPMIAARERFDFPVAVVPPDASVESSPGKKLHQRREDQLACVRRSPFLPNRALSANPNSNRCRSRFFVLHGTETTYIQST
jgi:hypothetical protein